MRTHTTPTHARARAQVRERLVSNVMRYCILAGTAAGGRPTALLKWTKIMANDPNIARLRVGKAVLAEAQRRLKMLGFELACVVQAAKEGGGVEENREEWLLRSSLVRDDHLK